MEIKMQFYFNPYTGHPQSSGEDGIGVSIANITTSRDSKSPKSLLLPLYSFGDDGWSQNRMMRLES
ncbi:hypothetical protein ACEPPN_004709 [Leptodophora sp. 'Broadleaf-Isolate-01']